MSIPVIPRGPVAFETLVWVTAMNRSTGADETLGLWTGKENLTFNIGGSRSYIGAGPVLSVPSLVSQIGVKVQTQKMVLSAISDDVETLIRTYDARQAPIELHVARFNPETEQLLAVFQVFRGWIDQVTIKDGGKNAAASVDVTAVSASRELTRKVPDFRSDEAHQDRTAGADRAFRYADVSGSVPIYWGQKRA